MACLQLIAWGYVCVSFFFNKKDFTSIYIKDGGARFNLKNQCQAYQERPKCQLCLTHLHSEQPKEA